MPNVNVNAAYFGRKTKKYIMQEMSKATARKMIPPLVLLHLMLQVFTRLSDGCFFNVLELRCNLDVRCLN